MKPRMKAIFALRAQIGGRGRPALDWWVLGEDENWGDIVRGDGGSYSPGGPNDLFSTPGESVEAFRERVRSEAKRWDSENRDW